MNQLLKKLPITLLALLGIGLGKVTCQELTIKGKVISVLDGAPLEGVNILVRGTEQGTSTDKNGEYVLIVDIPSYADVFYIRAKDGPHLVFSYAGFRTLEVPVKGRPLIDVVMHPEATQLDEIIVIGTAVGRSSKLMSYSVGKLESRYLDAVPSQNFGAGLSGKIPGLRVNQVGGQPGQGVFFQIRSANAIANGQQPLIILDGVYLNGSTLADINPEDIESIEILKGSAGGSLYGSQAANGVIEIFTKRGKSLNVGESQVVVKNEVGYSETNKLYDINTLTNRAVLSDNGIQPVLGDINADNLFNAALPNLQNYQEKYLFQRGMMISNQVNVTGKSDRANYFFSAERTFDEGILKNFDGYTRNAFRANTDFQISNKLDFRISTMYSNSIQDLQASASNGPTSYLASLLFMTPMFSLESANEEDGSPFDWDIDNTGLSISNPLYVRANSKETVKRDRIIGGLRLNYYLNNWITFSYEAGLDLALSNYEHLISKGYLSNSIPGQFGPMVQASLSSNGGGINRTNNVNNALISRARISAQKKLGEFNFGAQASYLYEYLKKQFTGSVGENLAVSGIKSLDNAQSNILISSGDEQVVANSGFFVADLDYKRKYIFSGLFRVEGSSLFGREERWNNYYRLSAAYRLTEDLKIKGIEEFKLRASLGTAGVRPTFSQRFETFDLINGDISKNTLGNAFLRPANSKETEVGVNATFWKAFNLEFNFSKILTEDQILLVPLTAATGFRGQWKNAGAVSATVYEGSLGINFAKLFKMDTKGFDWEIIATFDRVEQMIEKLDVAPYTTGPGLQQSSLFKIEAGIPFGTMVGEVFATDLTQLDGQEGINPSDFTINEAGYVVHKDLLGTAQEVPYKLVDEIGNPLIQVIGDINPDFRMGFTNYLNYKNLVIFAVFDWKKGGDIYNITRQWLYQDLRHGDVSQFPDISASFYGNNGLYNALVANNHFVEDGSFFMLREASIGYTFEKKQLQGVFGNMLERAKISFVGRNIFTKTNYTGFHPDVTSPPRDENVLDNRFPDARGSDIRTPNGDPALFFVDAFNYPLRKSITFNLQLTF